MLCTSAKNAAAAGGGGEAGKKKRGGKRRALWIGARPRKKREKKGASPLLRCVFDLEEALCGPAKRMVARQQSV